nr:copia protein [Tanacetum cinerariifolium]
DVIENGNSFKLVPQTIANADTTSTSTISGPVTTEEKAQKKNDVKAKSITNEVDTANIQVSTVSTPVSTVSSHDNTTNLSDATMYAFLANQPNGSQLVHENLEQIHEDDLEEMDLEWQLDLLSMRSKRPRNQDSSRKTVNVENTSSKAMVAIDEACFDWSYMVDDEVPTNMALMVFSDSEEFQHPEFTGNGPKDSKSVCVDTSNEIKKAPDAPILKDWVSDSDEDEFEEMVIKSDDVQHKPEQSNQPKKMVQKPVLKNVEKETGQREVRPIWNNPMRTNHQKISNSRRNFAPTTVLTKFGIVPISTARQSSSVAAPPEHNGGYVTFGRGAKGGKITSKGTIRTGKLDFEDVYFVKELQFNLFSVSQICDKKNSVLFSDSECFVLSPNFKLADESQVLLKVPRKNNMRNKTLIEAARTMLANSKLPTTFWAKADNSACYVQNRVLVVKPHFKTPYELFRGRSPALSFMRPFECHVTVLNTLDQLGKFDRKLDEGIFVGYSTISKAFKVYNTRTRKVEENMHITFLENKPMIVGGGPEWLFDIDALSKSLNYAPVPADSSLFDSSLQDSDGHNKDKHGPSQASKSDNQERHNAKSSTKTVNTTGPVNTTTPTYVDYPSDPLMTDLEDTRIFDDAYDDKTKGAEGDYNNLETGHRHEEGIDYDEVFAPVARIEEIELFLAYASFIDFTVYQMDVKSVFLYGTIKEEVYVSQPLGFVDPEFPNRVYKVEKALYGLHQAPRAWYETLSTYLLDNRFRREPIDKTLFIKQIKNDILLVQVYVDDIIFGSTKSVKSTSTLIETHKPLSKDAAGTDVDVYLYRLISWQCKKQTIVANSIIEAEYIAASNCYGQFVDQHNMVAYLEKSDENIEFHQIVDFLSSCSINYALTVSPTIYASYIEQFWNTASSKTINSVKQIHDIIDGKVVVISESSVKSDLFFNDEDGITYLTNNDIFENLALMGYEPLSTKLTFQKAHLEPILQSPTVYQRQRKTQKHKRTQKDTELPQTSVPLHLRADEAVHQEGVTVWKRAITTDGSLEAAQTSNNILKTQTAAMPNVDIPQGMDTCEGHTSGSGEGRMEHTVELTDIVPLTPHDSPLIGGYTPGSDEETLMNIKRSTTKDKGKGIMQEIKLPKIIKKREMIQLSLDEELAQKLFAEKLAKETARQEQETYNLEKALELQRQLDKREKYVDKADQAQKINWNDPKNQGGYKKSYFKGIKYEDIRRIFEREEVEAQADSDQEIEEMKLYMRIVPDKDMEIDAIPLATKPLLIVEYKIVKEGKISTYQITRVDGSIKRYTLMINLLENINREDLEAL